MSAPTLVEGSLYIDRDFDVRTETWGPYVKIGIVKDNKTPEERVKELQTGNPRKVRTIKTYLSPMVENLETRLHHNFAEYWVRGEWFLMDENFVNNELHNTITKFIDEQEDSIEFFKKREELKEMLSNGNRREPTEAELELHSKYNANKIISDESNAKSQIIKHKIMDALGAYGGVEGIIELRKSITPEKITPAKSSFDKGKFKSDYPEKYLEFTTITYGSPKGSLLMKGTPTLASHNSELRDKEKDAKNECDRLKSELVDKDKKDMDAVMKSLHEEYVKLLGDIFNSELEMETIKAHLGTLLGEDEAIEGIIEWKRQENPKEKFDADAAQEKYPTEYGDCMVEKPEKITPEKVTVSIIVEQNRAYPL